MLNAGLKLWSTNSNYYDEAVRLTAEQICQYVELYVVPDSTDTISQWKTLKTPFVIHCSHFAHGFNLADANNAERNAAIFQQSKMFADALNASWIIFHGGMDGHIEETAKQLASFHESRALIENKPQIALPNRLGGKRCVGATVEEIKWIRSEIGCGFCLDFGHAICAANALGEEPYAYMDRFMVMNPTMYHLTNLEDMKSVHDSHLSLRTGELDIARLIKRLPEAAFVTFETKKQSQHDLKDFEEDMQWLKNL